MFVMYIESIEGRIGIDNLCILYICMSYKVQRSDLENVTWAYLTSGKRRRAHLNKAWGGLRAIQMLNALTLLEYVDLLLRL